MVNRCVGVHMVCGDVDIHFTVNTDNIFPHGANTMIEITKLAIEYLAEKLAEIGLILPKHIRFC